MKTTQTHNKMVEWFNAENMHDASKQWLSELNFAKVEHLFFDDLMKSYILQLIDSKHIAESKDLRERLVKLEKKINLLLRVVQTHEKKLKVMVDAIDQPQLEEAYKNEHRELILKISEFSKEYQTLKSNLFDIIRNIIKEGKQARFIDKL